MYHLRLLRVSLQVARHTVVKTHADGYEQVTLVCHHVRRKVAVHSEHTHIQRMLRRGSRQSEHSLAERYLCFLAKGKQFLASSGYLNALSHKHERLDTRIDHPRRLFYYGLL